MSYIKEEKIEELIKHSAAEFLQKESNRVSLITITKVELGERGGKAVIFFTVLPESAEEDALQFAKRRRSDFRDYIKSHTRIQRLPFIDFAIDFGEKNRQRIEELSQGK